MSKKGGESTPRTPKNKTEKESKLNELTLREKINLIDHYDKYKSQRETAEAFKVGKTTVCRILKRRAELMEEYMEYDIDQRSRKMRKTDFYEINDLTIKWFRRIRGNDLRVSGPMIQEAAKQFAAKLNVVEFTASNGWLESFKLRHHINRHVLNGESNEHVLSLIDNNKNASEIVKDVDMLKCVFWIEDAWKSVTAQTIQNCFIKAGFKNIERVLLENATTNIANTEIDKHLSKDYIGLDDNQPICKTYSNERLVDMVYDEYIEEKNHDALQIEEEIVPLGIENDEVIPTESQAR